MIEEHLYSHTYNPFDPSPWDEWLLNNAEEYPTEVSKITERLVKKYKIPVKLIRIRGIVVIVPHIMTPREWAQDLPVPQ